jgi:hypothetical protein
MISTLLRETSIAVPLGGRGLLHTRRRFTATGECAIMSASSVRQLIDANSSRYGFLVLVAAAH